MKQLLSDAIDDYQALRSSQDYSTKTLRNEVGVLRKFLTVTGNIYVSNISERHVTRHFEEGAKTRSANTMQLDHSVLAQFFDWARKTRRLPMDCDPMLGRRRPKTVRHERNRLHVSKFPHLLDVAGRDDPRNRAMVAVLLYTLLRDQDAASLRVRDVDLDGGWLRAYISKSRREDMLPICAELDAELRVWLTRYTAEVGPLEPWYYLLPRRQSVGIVTRDTAGRIEGHEMRYFPEQKVSRLGRVLTPILEAAGFPVKDNKGKGAGEGAHTIRRSGARALFDQLTASGYDYALRVVQSMLHHSSMQTTERYVGVSADRRTRDDILRGNVMFQAARDNVTELVV